MEAHWRCCGLLCVWREEIPHKPSLAGLHECLVLGNHEVAVLVQEVLCAVGDAPGVVLNCEAVWDEPRHAETAGALDLRRGVKLGGQVLVRGLRRWPTSSAAGMFVQKPTM